jgi:hypothetical protein
MSKHNAIYIAEGLRRAKIRKDKRKEERASKKERASRYCRGCGEDPYCYCGDGTPYSY